ncbi:MAG TPA: ABC transporter substrate-binding protein [Bryobacteraceae bacterium]|nr:ABC transporter substrate-binding protein [Bryobacteraceae bacterium]
MRILALLLVSVLGAGRAGAQWGGELKLALHSEPRTLNPAMVDDDASETVRYLTGGVLVRVNRLTQQPEPALARSWKILDGGKTYRFQLREGLSFSDGTPFTADDVVYTIEVLMDPGLHSPVGDSLRTGLGSVLASAEGPYAVAIRFPAPLAGGVKLFDQVAIESRRSPLKEAAVLGPFHAAERKPGAFIRLERNPQYWKTESGRRLPYLDSVRLDILQSRDVELMRFRRGELHLISSLDPDQFEELSREMPGLARDAGPALENEFLWFNMSPSAPLAAHEKEWFGSRNFRLAVSHAIRRDDLCRVVYHGHAIPGVGPFPAVNLFWFNRKLAPHAFDLDLAKRLLLEDGFHPEGGKLQDRAGHAVEFSLVTNAGNKARERIAAMLQQDLAALGIRLNVVTLDFPSLLERIGKTMQYESCLLGLNNGDVDPDSQMNVWLSSSSNHAWNPRQASPATPWEAEIDRLMKAQASEAVAARRKALFDRVQEIVWEQAPIIYVLNRNALVAVAQPLGNVRPSVLAPRVIWNIDEIYLAGTR